MKTYHIARKYKMPAQFEMLDLGVEGLESRDDIKKELEEFDKLAKKYKMKNDEPFPDRVVTDPKTNIMTLKKGKPF